MRQKPLLPVLIDAEGLDACDFKAAHVIIAPDARLHIIDFEHAYDLRSGATPHRSGTPGYQSPQRKAGARPAPTDDIYSLGALLFYLATGADPHEAPRRGDLSAAVRNGQPCGCGGVALMRVGCAVGGSRSQLLTS